MEYKYLFVITTFCYGLSSFLNRFIAGKIHPYYIQIIIAATSSILIPVYWYLAKLSGISTNYDIKSIAIVVTSTIISIIGSLIMLYAIAKSNNPASLSAIISMYPLISLGLSIVFLHETITLQKVVAICLMITSIMVLIW